MPMGCVFNSYFLSTGENISLYRLPLPPQCVHGMVNEPPLPLPVIQGHSVVPVNGLDQFLHNQGICL